MSYTEGDEASRDYIHPVGTIIFGGYWYAYQYRLAKQEEICLGTTNPKTFCNGLYSYSNKDPGDGLAFVVIDTNDPTVKAELLLKEMQP